MAEYHITTTADDTGLTICVTGRIDTTNAADFGAALASARAEHPEGALELDLAGLDYISSAGLRELLKLQKAEGAEKVRLAGVSREVYDILETTGFAQIFDVRRALREFSIDGLELIGQGLTGRVYRVDDETIIKVDVGVKGYLEQFEHEREMAQQALIAGVPTAIAFDTVRVPDIGDGRAGYGLLFELVRADTLAHAIATAETDEEVSALGAKWGELLKELHAAEADPAKVPSTKDVYIANMRKYSGPYYTPEQQDEMEAAIASVPERNTFVHGDLHPGNIMIQDGELLIIDMPDISHGHPIFDLAALVIDCINPNKRMPGATERLYGITEERMNLAWDAIISTYFGTSDPAVIEAKTKMISGFVAARYSWVAAMGTGTPKEILQRTFMAALQMLPGFKQVVANLDALGV